MSDAAADPTEPGWYDRGDGLMREWNGRKWTGRARMKADGEVGAVAAPPPPSSAPAAVPLRADIAAAKAQMKRSSFGAGRELFALPRYLVEGEVVHRIAVGTYAKATGLLALTDQRLLFLKSGLLGQTFEDYPLGTVTSVAWSGGIVMGTLRFTVSGARAEITQVANPDGHAMADAIRGAMGSTRAMVQPKTPAPAAPDIPGQLMQLKGLLDAGVLDQAEFDAKKIELLARM